MHVNCFIDDYVLDLAPLDESGGLAARGVAGGQLNAQGPDDEQGLVVHLHKVDVKHHADQGDENGTGQDSGVLREEEHCVRYEPHAAGVHHHLADGHFGGADDELPAEAGVALTVQRYGFPINVREGVVSHDARDQRTGRVKKTRERRVTSSEKTRVSTELTLANRCKGQRHVKTDSGALLSNALQQRMRAQS